jgi:hypothetical protein
VGSGRWMLDVAGAQRRGNPANLQTYPDPISTTASLPEEVPPLSRHGRTLRCPRLQGPITLSALELAPDYVTGSLSGGRATTVHPQPAFCAGSVQHLRTGLMDMLK